MQNIAATFLDYFRLERKRVGCGLQVRELERWKELKDQLDTEVAGSCQERRTSPRVPTRLHCSFASRTEFDKAVITNLSQGGVFISTTSPLAVGSKLSLNLHVGTEGTTIGVEGIVVSNHVGREFDTSSTGMGVRFSRVGAETIQAIYDLYEHELERELLEKVQLGSG